MSQRISVLTTYFMQRLFTSVSGGLYIMLALGYWVFLFNPQQQTPDVDYFILVAGLFGPLMAFLITLTLSNWANQAINYPFLVRLPSRVEYLTAVFLAAFISTLLLQLLLAVLALTFHGPSLGVMQLIELPPLWLAPIILAITLALHASDLVTAGWSRVYIFGVLAIFLFGQSLSNDVLLRLLNSLNRYVSNQGWIRLIDPITNGINTLSMSNSNIIARTTGAIFWPFQAITEAILRGSFDSTEAMAPAIMLLYATILFILAADIFVNKDLILSEA